MYIASEYYWDDDDVARVFAKRFFAIENHMPTKLQAATYASVRHYLKAIQAGGTDDAKIVGAQMRKMEVDSSAGRRASGPTGALSMTSPSTA